MTYKDLYNAAKSRYFYETVKYWKKTKIFKNYIPELEILSYYNQNPKYHPEADDVFGHVLECLKYCRDDSPIVKLSVLFHDIGKGVTATGYNKIDHPYYNFYGHEHAGIYVMKDISKRFTIPDKDLEIILFCIRYHMQAHKFLEMRPCKIRNVRLNRNYDILKKVSYCDSASRNEKFDIDRFNKNIKFADWVILQPENLTKNKIDYSIFK